MNLEQINQEMEKWNDPQFLSEVTTQFNQYVGSLDELLASRYSAFIRSISQRFPDIAEMLKENLTTKNLLTYTRTSNSKFRCCITF